MHSTEKANKTVIFLLKRVIKFVAMKLSITIEQRVLKNVNNCLITNIYSYFETSGGKT
jgi:hypothetical protein